MKELQTSPDLHCCGCASLGVQILAGRPGRCLLVQASAPLQQSAAALARQSGNHGLCGDVDLAGQPAPALYRQVNTVVNAVRRSGVPPGH